MRSSLRLLAALVLFPSTAAAQNLRERAREYAREHPGVPYELPAPPGEYWPKTIQEVAREADVVLLAKLSRMKSYLSSNENGVVTDYSIADQSLIAGRLPVLPTQTPGTVVPLILTVNGGEVIVDGGVVRLTDTGREAIKDGGEYLLFLKQSRLRPETGRYDIYYGAIFDISQDMVKPLLRQADGIFKGTTRAPLRDLISQIETAVHVR
jgi:hypothetical protein